MLGRVVEGSGESVSGRVEQKTGRMGVTAESAGLKQIIDFLKSKPIHYALTVNPTIYVSCVKQFWATTKVKRVNDQEQIQALVDKKKVIITEDSIRSDIRFDDAEGTTCLPSEAIFEGLARIGAKTTAWNEFSSTMASAIICLADNQKFNFSKHKEMYVISSYTKKIFTNMRRIRAGFSGRKEAEVSLDESEDEDNVPTPSSDPLPSGEDSYTLHKLMVFYTSLQEQVFDLQEAKDAQSKEIAALKKKERMIKEIDHDDEIVLDANTQGRKTDDEMFGVDDLIREEVVTTVADKVSAAPTTNVTEDEIIMAQALASLKSIKPIILAAATNVTTVVLTLRAKGIVFHEQKKSHIPTVSSSKDKGKAKIIEPEDNTQAMMEAESLLAEGLQAREKEEFSEKQKVDENVKPVIDDTEELKRCMEIVPDDEDEVLIEATPISSISLTIIDYKVHKEGKKKYLKIIRANVKDRFKKEKPVEDMDNLLFRTLKTMFEHHVEDTIWKYQQGLAKVKNWKLFESCEMYCITMQSIIYYLLVEKVYPLTRNTLHQLWNDVRLQVDYDAAIAYDLFRFIRKQLMEGYTPQ
nr:hypothetical protein [Tanacetum cinerariifolium]